MKTFRYRIKDSNKLSFLRKTAGAVNHVWNLTQNAKLEHLNATSKFLTYKELAKQVKLPGQLNSATTQHVIKQYCTSSFQFKKPKLKWRSAKHSLGWIPCTNQNLKFNTNSGMFKYAKLNFRTWYDRPVQGKILSCSMSADSRGRWYVNIITDYEDKRNCGVRQIGIDLGVKDIITCSDGTKYSRTNITNHYAKRLAMAQRAKKKKQVKAINAKIKNTRKDWNHKVTTQLCNTSSIIAVGDIGTKKLLNMSKRGLSRALSDAAHYEIKSMLFYKAIRHGIEYKVISEKFSSITCSECFAKSGPKGLSGLRIRAWNCSSCGASHDRDVNAAKNIFCSLRGIVGFRESLKIA